MDALKFLIKKLIISMDTWFPFLLTLSIIIHSKTL